MDSDSPITILIHSSKTMRVDGGGTKVHQPYFIDKAEYLNDYLKTLSRDDIERVMRVSPPLADSTHGLIGSWSSEGKTLAIYSFIGDIYSGLRAGEMTPDELAYANKTLIILSGLYGALRPLDGIVPYRLEMGYKFPDSPFKSIYNFWGSDIARLLPPNGPIINVSSAEYMKVVEPFVDSKRIVTPKFLTINPKTGQPAFTAVHAKIARGAFARWLIKEKITNIGYFNEFDDLGYRFSEDMSLPGSPTYICKEFGGKGLSVRLTPYRLDK